MHIPFLLTSKVRLALVETVIGERKPAVSMTFHRCVDCRVTVAIRNYNVRSTLGCEQGDFAPTSVPPPTIRTT